tara:strand:+ start:8557 stop:9189 length:633 start_codon:yes stop_codon:yes gene_type:complete
MKKNSSENNINNKEVVLIGCGGNIFDIAEALLNKGYKIIGYVNDKSNPILEDLLSIKYFGDDQEYLNKNSKNSLITFAGIGDGIKSRKKAFSLYKDTCLSFTFPDSKISNFAQISSKGVLIFGSTTIKSFCKIMDNVFINTGSIIGHHTTIKSNTVISINVKVGGNVIIEEDVFIGMGAMIFEGLTIGKGSIIGAGKVIRKNISSNEKVI